MSDTKLSRSTTAKSIDVLHDASGSAIDADSSAIAERRMMRWVPLVVPMMAVGLCSMIVLVLLELRPG